MKSSIYKIVVCFTVLMIIINSSFNVFAINVVFKGSTDTSNSGKSVAIVMYKNGTDLSNVLPIDINYIEQSLVDENGKFEFNLPVDLDTVSSSTVISTYSGNVRSDTIPLYVSNAGSDTNSGTQQSPYTFEKAIDEVIDGGKIVLMDEVKISDDFVWPETDKTITISGEGYQNAELDIEQIVNLVIGCNTTFEHLTIGCTEQGTGNEKVNVESISANGYHVIIADTVTTQNICAIRGGHNSKAVNSTNLEVYGGNWYTIYGGGSNGNIAGNCILTVGGNVNSAYSVKDSDDNYVPTKIHGGCWGGIIKGDCITTLKGNAKAAYVYAGTHAQTTSYTEGKVELNVEGGNYMNIFAAAFITSGHNPNVTINFKGGTAEGVFATDNTVLYGDVKMNFTGGTVTRRIYGGAYNDCNIFGVYSKDLYVNGNITMTFDEGFTFANTGDAERGIFAGSRYKASHTEEKCMMIFLNDSYNNLQNYVKTSATTLGMATVFAGVGDGDYIVIASKGGKVGAETNSTVNIEANDGYTIRVDDADFVSNPYALANQTTNVVFVPFASGLSGLEFENNKASVNFNVNKDKFVLVAAVYDKNNMLVAANHKNITQSAGSDEIELNFALASGQTYTVKTMLWNTMADMQPICSAITITVPNV